MSGWPTVPLLEVCRAYQPQTIGRKDMVEDGPYPVYGANGVIGRYHSYNHEDSEVLLGCRGSCGSVNVSVPGSWVTGNAMVVKPKDNRLSKEFLRYFLAGSPEIAKTITGVAQPQITQKSLAPVVIPIPPAEQQRRVVAVLDEAFAAIDSAIANTEKNMAHTWKMSQAFAESFFASSPGGRGADRRKVPLGKVCKLVNGRAYAKNELLAKGETPVLRVGNFFTNPNWYYSNLRLDEDKYADDGDLLYAWSASFGPRIWNGGRVIYHYHIWKLLPDESQLDKRYVFHFLEWDKEQVKAAHGAGATMIHVTKASMEARPLPLPSLDEQRRIADRLDRAAQGAGELAALQIRKMEALKNLKQSLLHNALSGQLVEREPLAA